MSFQQFQKFLTNGVDVQEHLIPQMKSLVIKSLISVRKKIDPLKRKYSFELFGYDFILDEDQNIFLIEVNTNPCIEESSEMLKKYLPRMIEDMLKLTVDQMFPRPRKATQKGKGSPTKKPGSGSLTKPQPSGTAPQEIKSDGEEVLVGLP